MTDRRVLHALLLIAMLVGSAGRAQTTAVRADTVPGPNVPRTIVGAVFDSVARVTISGVAGEWRTDADGRFVARGLPTGLHAVSLNVLGFEQERRLVDLAPGDSGYLDLSMTPLITRLRTISVREREHFNEIKSELDQRRRSGFGYRTDSLELAKLPGLMEAFNFPGVSTGRRPGGWGIGIVSGVQSIACGPTKSGGQATCGGQACSPTIWIDGSISDIQMLNDIQKEEVALIEVFKTAARAPLQFGGTRTNCGVVLVWRKSYINQ